MMRKAASIRLMAGWALPTGIRSGPRSATRARLSRSQRIVVIPGDPDGNTPGIVGSRARYFVFTEKPNVCSVGSSPIVKKRV